MNNTRKPNPSRPDADNPEWTRKDIARARPAAEVLPGLIGAKATEELFRRGRGRPPKATRKVNQTIRLDPDVLDDLRARGVKFHSLTEAIDTATPTSRAMWQMIGIPSELERSLISERTRAGVKAAQRRGVKFGRKLKLTAEQIGPHA
jgi:DNA invertase Pin-like site-specific DNA recombinase